MIYEENTSAFYACAFLVSVRVARVAEMLREYIPNIVQTTSPKYIDMETLMSTHLDLSIQYLQMQRKIVCLVSRMHFFHLLILSDVCVYVVLCTRG